MSLSYYYFGGITSAVVKFDCNNLPCKNSISGTIQIPVPDFEADTIGSSAVYADPQFVKCKSCNKLYTVKVCNTQEQGYVHIDELNDEAIVSISDVY